MTMGIFFVLLINMNLENIKTENFNKLSDNEKKFLHEMYADKETPQQLKRLLENALYEHKPPTPEEFLDPKNRWLPQAYVDGLYPYVKEDFIQAMKNEDPYSTISMYGCTRSGKSTMARLAIIYTLIYINYLRDPHTFYGINKMSRISLYLVSFKQDKTNQILLSPILNILHASEMFIDERFEKNVYRKGLDNQGRIHYSEAGKFGDITFPKCYINTGRDASSLVGADIVAGVVSEITYFKQYAPGMTDEDIKRVYTKLHTRIQNTVGFGNFPCWTYIDSSANNADSPLEKMILNELRLRKNTFYRHYVLWELRPHLYPKYHETGKTFKVCTGHGNIKAHIISSEEDLSKIPNELIIDVPIDLYDTFEDELVDSIRDIAGKPTSSVNKFIQNPSVIKDLFSNNDLRNIEGGIVADARHNPDQLIWNQIRDVFFNKYNQKDYIIYRAPKESRIIALDTAHSAKGDLFGITMAHLEFSNELEMPIVVVDFSFPIMPGEEGINLTAVEYFIVDLMIKGNIGVLKVNSDTFQSKQIQQNLKRVDIDAEILSVDRSLVPYQDLLTRLNNETVKAGRNIFLKNNLSCLERVINDKGKEKIDHPIGSTNNQYYGDWERATCGTNAKDVSDTLASICHTFSVLNIHPSTVYEQENKKFSDKEDDKKELVKEAVKTLYKVN
jgi:hypothetical protein